MLELFKCPIWDAHSVWYSVWFYSQMWCLYQEKIAKLKDLIVMAHCTNLWWLIAELQLVWGVCVLQWSLCINKGSRKEQIKQSPRLVDAQGEPCLGCVLLNILCDKIFLCYQDAFTIYWGEKNKLTCNFSFKLYLLFRTLHFNMLYRSQRLYMLYKENCFVKCC